MEICKTCEYDDGSVNGIHGMCKYCRDGECYKRKIESEENGNEEKAREIAHNNSTHAHCSHGEHFFTSESDCYKAAMAMSEWKDKQCCANCEYLNIYNDKALYALCAKWGWNFLPFQADTRTTKCGQFEAKKGDNNEK